MFILKIWPVINVNISFNLRLVLLIKNLGSQFWQMKVSKFERGIWSEFSSSVLLNILTYELIGVVNLCLRMSKDMSFLFLARFIKVNKKWDELWKIESTDLKIRSTSSKIYDWRNIYVSLNLKVVKFYVNDHVWKKNKKQRGLNIEDDTRLKS